MGPPTNGVIPIPIPKPFALHSGYFEEETQANRDIASVIGGNPKTYEKSTPPHSLDFLSRLIYRQCNHTLLRRFMNPFPPQGQNC